MTLYGYARVSSLDQDLTLQEVMLRAVGCQVVRAEKKSGTAREEQSGLRLRLDFLHKGDMLVVTRTQPRCAG
jgi:DNA invertase Pin-like site-specific DNA recombinase